MFIPWNTTTQGITVSTGSEVESEEQVAVWFYDKDGNWSGNVYIYFGTPIEYYLTYCTPWIPFSTLPPEKQKSWTIRYDSNERRVVIHCNEEEVLNLLLSSECTDSGWRDVWEKETTQIQFFSGVDTASDSYCFSGNPGKYNFGLKIFLEA